MSQPYVGEAGRIRLSPLQKAVVDKSTASTSVKEGGSRSISVDPRATALLGGGSKTEIPVNHEDVSKAIADAQAGDENAKAWLATMGIAVGGSIALGTMASRDPKFKTKQYGFYDPNAPSTDAEFSDLTGRSLTVPSKGSPAQGQLTHQPATLPNGVQVQEQLPGGVAQISTSTDNARVPGPTLKQAQVEAALAQKAAQDAKVANRAAQTGQGAAARRAYELANALKGIRRVK